MDSSWQKEKKKKKMQEVKSRSEGQKKKNAGNTNCSPSIRHVTIIELYLNTVLAMMVRYIWLPAPLQSQSHFIEHNYSYSWSSF